MATKPAETVDTDNALDANPGDQDVNTGKKPILNEMANGAVSSAKASILTDNVLKTRH